ncbi:hypothetical protein [Sphingomonas nostoxanthinifaciens]|uniref:hypothetical protein n=1 Tax=Sphingomonas nostoxanthinifaciens TaxID=2872652 RepID=UPI001CC1EEE5|nr:hypothetical protein [Sphingomonas nostoxanthinifaciens]UAK25618.1 hypothetical protein K8P63_05575 [Sphingomonas nostoxanthinifaciens]
MVPVADLHSRFNGIQPSLLSGALGLTAFWIDELVKAARGDRGFPRNATAADVHARLVLLGADPDMFEQLEDAQRAWLA